MKTITRYFSLFMMALVLLLPAQAANRMANIAQKSLLADEAPLVVANPDPSNGPLETVPEQVILTFSQDITNASMPAVVVGMGEFIDLDPADVSLEGRNVTVKLPVDKLAGLDYFEVSLRVDDANGEAITVGEMMGFVTIAYNLATSPNTYKCTQVTPAEGEVQQLNEFVLKFVDENAFAGDGVIGGVDTLKEVCLLDEYYTVVARGVINVDYENFASEAKVTLNQPIIADGNYSLVVPEGTFYNEAFNPEEADYGVANFGAIYNPELTFNYTVKSVPTVTVDPDPAVALKEVPNVITLTFEKEVKKVTEAAVNLGSGYSIPLEEGKIAISGKVVKVQLPVEEIKDFPGFVVVMVVEDNEGNLVSYGGDIDCVTLDYNIQQVANTFVCDSITPAEGEIEFLENFVLTFSSGNGMVGGFDDTKRIVVMNQLGQEVAVGTPGFSSNWDNISDVEIALDHKITEAGTYFLTIPEGAIYDGNYNMMEDDFGVADFGATYNPELVYTYIVSGSQEVKEVFALDSVNPAEGAVKSLSKFEVTLKNAKDPRDFIGGIVEGKEAVLKNAAGEEVAKGALSFNADDWNAVFTVVLDKVIDQDGDYTLVIPENSVYNSAFDPMAEDHGDSWGAIANAEISLHYTIGESTGIENVQPGIVPVKVYTLSGVYVGQSLKNLPKGVYIVNGKKVIVK